jgi:hypothetical protein
MQIQVINTISLIKNPEFKNIKTINKNFKKIKKEHCNSLLEFLYNGGISKWQNPFTKKFLRRESPIVISFLSRCYNMDDDSKINIHGCNLTYKEHINKFINKEYLYVSSKKKSTNSNISNANIQSALRGGFSSSSRSSPPIINKIHRYSNTTIDTGDTWQPAFAQPFEKPIEQSHTMPSYIYQIPPRRHSNTTIDTGTPLHFNTVNTWPQPYINTVNTWPRPYINTVNTWPPPYINTVNTVKTWQPALAQSFVKHREQLNNQSPSYTFQIPHRHTPHHDTYLQNPPYTPIQTYSRPISKSQQKGKFYQSLNSKIKYYQREIPDDIWKLIMKLGIYYLGDERGEFIDKMNEKYEKDKEILDKWEIEEREEPDKNRKKIKEYYKREKSDRVYWSHGFYNFQSNAFEIDDIKAFNKFYGIKTLWDIFNKVDD